VSLRRAVGYGLALLAASAAFLPITERWSSVNAISTLLLVRFIQAPLLFLEVVAFACVVAFEGKRWAWIVQATLAAVIVASGVFYLTRGRLG
jgi:ABC-type bacteriocin/lantibiotic exporter with double-glycine peptidase domain